MALFISDEEKQKIEERDIKNWENEILKNGRYTGKVGHVHQGLSLFGVWGVRNNGKMKFKSSKFEIHDTKLLIERNKMIIEYSNIKEIFHENDNEAIIILYNDTGVPIKSLSNSRGIVLKFIAFINILNRLIKENKTDSTNGASNESNNRKTSVNSEDKFDKLIKLGEMHDKGLLSDEEFASLKQELLSGNDENTSDQSEKGDVELSENVCENCSAEIVEDSIFCAECGTKIR